MNLYNFLAAVTVGLRRGGTGGAFPSPDDYRVWWSVVSSPIGVRARALGENEFWCILILGNASDG